MKAFPTLITVLFVSVVVAHADLLDQLGLTKPKSGTNQTSGPSLSSLSQDQMIGGLKEALSKGVERAVNTLGQNGGFLTNLAVKIPMPAKLQSAEKALRALGQEKLAEDFVASMNHAAEQAVPQAAQVFGDAIKQMTIEDARNIIGGSTNAATQFFRRTTETNLYAKFFPIVQKATEQVGVTAAYKQMIGKVGSAESLGGLFGGKTKTAMQTADLDAYVTNKALDGLFKMVAEEEKSIRTNPMARTTDLLQKVFGTTGK